MCVLGSVVVVVGAKVGVLHHLSRCVGNCWLHGHRAVAALEPLAIQSVAHKGFGGGWGEHSGASGVWGWA